MKTSRELKTTVSQEKGVTLIRLDGEINSFAQQALQSAIDQAQENPPGPIVLDFHAVDYINSTGIALIVTLLVQARKSGRRLSASGLSPHYQEIFALTRLNEYMTIYGNLDQAVQSESER